MRYLITGAAGGIGGAVARLAAKGADGTGPVSLALVDRKGPVLDAVAAELTA